GRRGGRSRASRSEYPTDRGAGEDPVGVEAVADAGERVPLRVAGRQRLGGLRVELAPVRPPAGVEAQRLDEVEERAGVHPAVLVDGEVAGVAAVGGGEVGVVARDEAHLERE